MLEDALIALTHRGDIIIDPFLGSGSTLIASEKTGWVCRGVTLDPFVYRRCHSPPRGRVR